MSINISNLFLAFNLNYILTDTLKLGFAYALVALGIFISFRVLDIPDLTAEGSFTLGGALSAFLLVMDWNPWIATLMGMIAGFGAGVITGLIHTKLHVSGLLSGIITMTGLFSLNLIIMGFAPKVSTVNDELVVTFTEGGYAATVPLMYRNIHGEYIRTIYSTFSLYIVNNNLRIILIGLSITILFVGLLYLIFGTKIGMSIRATGINPHMARAQGINTNLMIILGLGISNALIAVGGACFAQVQGSASSTMGVGVLVLGLASIIMGEAIIGKKHFWQWLLAMVGGSIAYYLIIVLAIQLGLPTFYQKLLYAILILIVLSVTLFKEVLTSKHRKNAISEGDNNVKSK